MSNTTKNNVLLIAPQLETFVRNTRQSILCDISAAVDSREYTINIDNVPLSITSVVSATRLTIAAQFVAEINSAYSNSLVAKDNLDGTFVINVKDSNSYVNIDSDTDLYMLTSISQISRRGELLFDLVLEDVAIVCTEEWFKTEQERAQRYLTAHILTVLQDAGIDTSNTRSAGDIIKERVNEVELWYSDGATDKIVNLGDTDLLSTPYGKTFLEIRSRRSMVFI